MLKITKFEILMSIILSVQGLSYINRKGTKMVSKIMITIIIVIFLFVCCQDNNSTEPYNYEHDTPVWLKTKIDSLVTNDINGNNVGTEAYRYLWENGYVYHIYIPSSMCRYCLLFNKSGNRIYFNNSQEVIDFEKDRKNKIIIWEWKK